MFSILKAQGVAPFSHRFMRTTTKKNNKESLMANGQLPFSPKPGIVRGERLDKKKMPKYYTQSKAANGSR